MSLLTTGIEHKHISSLYLIGILFIHISSTYGQQGGVNLSYNEILRQNEALRAELSSLRARVAFLTEKCSCPSDGAKCDYEGRTYRYQEAWQTADCQRCYCDVGGAARCQHDSSIGICSSACSSNPCKNGGTCVSQHSDYYCICPPDCSGKQCEIREAFTCSLPLDEGQVCADSIPSMIWYFDELKGACTNAEYMGCGGNSNRFETKEECDSRCVLGTCCKRRQLRTDLVFGHSVTGYDRYGFKDGFDERGLAGNFNTSTAFGSSRYRFNGIDYKGYRSDGYNKGRYTRSGYDCQGVNPQGLNMDGVSSGFNYTCQLVSLYDCKQEAKKKTLASEVISFTSADDSCTDNSCNPYSDSTICHGCRYHGKFYSYEESFFTGCNQCMCTRSGTVQCTCTKRVTRKEIRDMTANEVEAYQLAIREVTSKSCDITIPYFDWSADAGALSESPAWRAGLFSGNGTSDGCVLYHPFAGYDWSPCLRRSFNTSVALPDVVAIERIKRSSSLEEISSKLMTTSVLFRMWVGGDSLSTHSIYDPVMISHYAFMDKIWRDWQERADNFLLLDPATRYKPLEPFGVTADDVLGSVEQLCVDYAPIGSLCESDVQDGQGRPYNLADPRAFDRSGYDSAGYDSLGYNVEGFNADGFNKDGYAKNGYDRYGFDKSGLSPSGLTRSGEITSRYNRSIYDQQNYTRIGLDYRGIDKTGRDIYGYNARGFNEDGCNGHFQDGYNYLKQKYELELDLEKLNDKQLDKINRLCSELKPPASSIMIMSWVIVDPTHALRGNRQTQIAKAPADEKLWLPDGPDARLCADINLYSACGLGQTSTPNSCRGTNPCLNTECPTYGAEATCRAEGCDGVCRAEWYFNGEIVTSSCQGCVDISTQSTYREGATWTSSDGCQRCQCVAGVSRCLGCPPARCPNPDTSNCCPQCAGCTYEGQTYSNTALFQPPDNPCDRCQCRDGHVTCQQVLCPSVRNCRDPLTREGSCCPICLSCDDKRNGERWYQDDCTVCQCRDGVTSCTEVTCGPVSCTHPVTIPGVCCPQCKACSYQGAYYTEGRVFSPDGCQTCQCNHGNITCIPAECPAVDCEDPYRAHGSCCPTCLDGCEYSGRRYDEGSVFTPRFNPCMNCTCSDRKIRCGPVSCPPTPELTCSRPVALPGDCCPSFCPSCVFEGVEYNNGDRFKPDSKPCDICLCYNGVVSCRSTTYCDKTCSYGVYESGSCCSECTDCLIDGEIYQDGSTFSHSTDEGCSVCTCSTGNLQCSPRKASCPPNDCSNPIKDQKSCCAECPKCDNGRSHRERWREETNPCEICECYDGTINCYPQPCPAVDRQCLSEATPDGECCPLCIDCVTVEGQRYKNGSTYQPPARNCEQCVCFNGETICERNKCPAVSCDNPVVLPDKCCPTCVSRECNYKGRQLPNGHRFSEGCNLCICQNTEVTCVAKICPPLLCQHPVKGECCPSCTDCNWRGQLLKSGSSVTIPDICQNCTCVSGTVTCQPVSCPQTSTCDFPIRSECCVSCDQGCDVNGVVYREEQDVEEMSTPCRPCVCQGGNVVCEEVKCEPVSCAKPIRKGCCLACESTVCTVYGLTVLDGVTVYNASTCDMCTCTAGYSTCEPVDCVNPKLSMPQDTKDKCCKAPPDPNSCNIRGVIYSDKEIIPELSLDCKQCTCQQGNILCTTPECATVFCTHPVKSDCCRVCDQGCDVNGVVYGEGQDIDVMSTACRQCVCQGGNVVCEEMKCEPILCDRPIRKGCCLACESTDCNIYGQTVLDGETVYNASTCDMCTCTAGYSTCEPVDCENPKLSMQQDTKDKCCKAPPDPNSCNIRGVIYSDKEIIPELSLDCKQCTCQQGNVLCTTPECPPVFCSHPVKSDCCLVCDEGCDVDGTIYRQGETIEQDDPCQYCRCNYGGVICERLRCLRKNGCLREVIEEGECCPRCEGCQVNAGSAVLSGLPPLFPTRRGKRQIREYSLEDGESFTDTQSCQTCECYAGETTCYPLSCPEVTCTNPYKENCCLSCDLCSTADGEQILNGTSVVDRTDPCSECTCINGNLMCQKLPCPAVECVTSASSADSCGCPVCSVCEYEGIQYSEGHTWVNSNSCKCKCQEGETVCEVCDSQLSCLFTEPAPGTCCGTRCKGCLVDGIQYQSGSTWTDDGCQKICSCVGGIISCMENLTPNDRCVDYSQSCLVSFPDVKSCCDTPACNCQAPDGTDLPLGGVFKLDTNTSCGTCTCVQGDNFNLYLQCFEPVCPDISRCPKDRIRLADSQSCCPVCEDSLPFECSAGTEGVQTTGTVNPCVTCTCSQGSWHCKEQTCPILDCPQSEILTEPGKCCPTCAGCYNSDVRKPHGAAWQHTSDPCVTCECNYGRILCETTVICPPLFCTEGRKPFTPEGQCCQICGDPITGDDCLDNQGKSKPHGSGWALDDCTVCECLYGKVDCMTESCPILECKSDETLVIDDGVCCPRCVKQPAVCKVYGDPHYKTFDGETVHFQGFCSYEMVKSSDTEDFRIIAVHDDRTTRSVSWIKAMIIEIYSIKIKLGSGLWATVNNVNVTFPFQHSSGVVLKLLPAAVQVTAEEIGLKITWDGSDYAEVEADTKLKSKVCGLCGNFNDNPSDELTTRDGVRVESHAQFGDSWLVPGSECSARADDEHPCDVAGYDVKVSAIERCSKLQSETFQPCHRVVPPDDYVYSCVYDMCACNSTDKCLCDILTAYSAACANSYVNIIWRTPQLCAIKCDTSRGFLFDECGPPCPRTCDNYNKPLGVECFRPCEPSCQCPAGLVQHNGRCITTDLCP